MEDAINSIRYELEETMINWEEDFCSPSTKDTAHPRGAEREDWRNAAGVTEGLWHADPKLSWGDGGQKEGISRGDSGKKRNLHEELDLRIQGTQVDIETTPRVLQIRLTEIEAWVER
jgi:hypothetical protein